MHSLSLSLSLVPLRAKTTMNYTDYRGSDPHPQAVTRGGGQLRTPKLSLADAVTTFALFLILRLPLAGEGGVGTHIMGSLQYMLFYFDISIEIH